MSSKSIRSGNATKKKGGGLIPIVGICCAAVLVGAVAFLGQDEKPDNKPDDKRNVVINKENLEEVLNNMAEEDFVPLGSYEAKMSSNWVFADGKSASENAYVENVVANSHDVYFDIMLSDTKERIYASPVLPIGSHLEAITLDKDLDAGTYDCILEYHLVDEEQNTISTVSFALTIIVQN